MLQMQVFYYFDHQDAFGQPLGKKKKVVMLSLLILSHISIIGLKRFSTQWVQLYYFKLCIVYMAIWRF